MLRYLSGLILAGAATYEGFAAQKLWQARRSKYDLAVARAKELQRPLLVVGDPDSGIVTRAVRATGYGDLCVDLHGCPRAPIDLAADLNEGLPRLASDSAVVYVSCVLEYVDDPNAVAQELLRVAGSPQNLIIVTVDPNTLTSFLYPTARWALRNGQWVAVDTTSKLAVAAPLAVTSIALGLSFIPKKKK